METAALKRNAVMTARISAKKDVSVMIVPVQSNSQSSSQSRRSAAKVASAVPQESAPNALMNAEMVAYAMTVLALSRPAAKMKHAAPLADVLDVQRSVEMVAFVKTAYVPSRSAARVVIVVSPENVLLA